MLSKVRTTAVTVFASAALVGGGAMVPAQAQQVQDGLVNVAIGDITIEDVNVGVAANIAANVCGVKVGPVAVLGRAVDRTGTTETVCTNDGGVRLIQN